MRYRGALVGTLRFSFRPGLRRLLFVWWAGEVWRVQLLVVGGAGVGRGADVRAIWEWRGPDRPLGMIMYIWREKTVRLAKGRGYICYRTLDAVIVLNIR